MTYERPPGRASAEGLAGDAAMYRLMVENSADIIIHYDARGTRIYASPACRTMVGYEPEEMLGTNAVSVIHPDDLPEIHPRFKAFGPDQPYLRQEFRMQRKDGVYIWVEAHHRYVPQDGTSIGIIRDVTDRKNAELLLAEANAKLEAANDILRRLSEQDGLTGLANRRRFDALLAQEYARAARREEPVAVLLLDVDCFKSYNDRYGHLAGDECLRQIARALETGLHRPGDLAARYGGEEFVVLLSATDLTGAMRVAEALRVAVASLAIEHRGSPHQIVTISVGASAVVPFEDDTAAQLVDAADRALYGAKGEGRNRVRGGDPRSFISVAPFMAEATQVP